MGLASKYWQLVKLTSIGKRRIEMITAAKTYFYHQFPDLVDQSEVSDGVVQRDLWQQQTSADRALAQLCLRCYISHQVDQTCRDLSIKFGSRNGFTYDDILPFVLDDDGRLHDRYRSLSLLLLETFDPAKGLLNTWTSRYVKQHPELRRFLLQHGVYLVTDWAILNDTTTKQLQRILLNTYQFSAIEIDQASELLTSFHAVYRDDRLKARSGGFRQACQPPTVEQLDRIAADLRDRTQRTVSGERILSQLNSIAQKVRRYRIAAQGGSIETISSDRPEIGVIVDRPTVAQDDNEQVEFLKFYQTQFLDCLDVAIADVIPNAIALLQKKRKPADQAFLTALHLFHCQGQSMSDIAPQIGFKQQYEVTRLLKLNDLRADIRHRSIAVLRDRVIDKAKLYATVEALQQLDQHVQTILDEQIGSVIQEAESETRAPIRNQPLRSLLARRLCHYLASRKSHS